MSTPRKNSLSTFLCIAATLAVVSTAFLFLSGCDAPPEATTEPVAVQAETAPMDAPTPAEPAPTPEPEAKTPEPEATVQEPVPAVYGLTVAPTPNDAQVRVLNVDSGYEPGMELEPGRYQLEVSREGYETSTQWVELGTEPLDVKVALKEVPKVVVPEAPAVPAAKPAPAQPAAPTSAVQMVYPGSAKYAPLNFEHHARHLALEQGCTACHHKWDKASPITGCRVSGCHADTSDKKAPTGYNMAFHSTAPNSCLGCHKKVKGTAPIKCSGCHTRK